MGKIKHFRPDRSLRNSLIIYVAVFACAALCLSLATSALCSAAAGAIQASYPPSGERYFLTNEDGERLGEGAYIGTVPVEMSQRDASLKAFLELLPSMAAPLYSAGGIIGAALLFYRNKLKRPLAELKSASEKIAGNDLDFTIDYRSNDELGQLCASFETMRSTLAHNFSDMWRQVEERKQLNAAFAHDLRTPLTVLKGYDEMLGESDDEQTRDTARTMGKHLDRMAHYIESMSTLRRLEDSQPEYRVITLAECVAMLGESARMLCEQAGKQLVVSGDKTGCDTANMEADSMSWGDEIALGTTICIDRTYAIQVCNNLISNAVRYARMTVKLFIGGDAGGLRMIVVDDGPGFSDTALSKAAQPYFTESGDASEHFGLGLYICRLLCEHHGGYLKLTNRPGASIEAFLKYPENQIKS